MKKLFQSLLFIVVVMASGVSHAKSYEATLDRVVDGDTIDIVVYLGFDIHIKQRIRLHGVDTPESRTKDKVEKFYGKLATQRVKELIPDKFMVLYFEDANEKYGRNMADIELSGDRWLGETLIKECHAVRYHGQNKTEVQKAHLANRECLAEKGIFPND